MGLSGNIIAFGLEIAVLFLRDFVPAVPYQPTSAYLQPTWADNGVPTMNTTATPTAAVAPTAPANDSLDSKVAELKHLRELGVLDDVTYQAAIKKIVEGICQHG